MTTQEISVLKINFKTNLLFIYISLIYLILLMFYIQFILSFISRVTDNSVSTI